ncbi:hypothetical protein PHYPO_G00119890 [Pangasianodon hypophthalmus]|uniref:Uncharacterized protein n=1 Tax=Pangasianodon hypophthalmus TaxID=310915 RepID=A0A5N5KZ92_PANHP|nr:hypothetical protein PHYPO_G00119890 [Pangasianodon hypophthalmus]
MFICVQASEYSCIHGCCCQKTTMACGRTAAFLGLEIHNLNTRAIPEVTIATLPPPPWLCVRPTPQTKRLDFLLSRCCDAAVHDHGLASCASMSST